MHQNHYFYSVVSKKILNPPQKIEEHYLWTQSRYFFSLSFFSAFLFFWVFVVSGFLGGLFLRGMKKQKKPKFRTKQNNQKTKKDEGPQDANKKTT